MKIAFKGGYKYQLHKEYSADTTIIPDEDIHTKYIDLDITGHLTIRAGYCWDGASAMVKDRPSVMRGSLEHDGLYQLFRGGYLSANKYKDRADRLFQHRCIDDGVPRWLASMYYRGLKRFGRAATKAKNQKKILWAPKD